MVCPVGSQNVRPAQAGWQVEELDIVAGSLAAVCRAAHHLRELRAARAEHPVAGRIRRAQKLACARAGLHANKKSSEQAVEKLTKLSARTARRPEGEGKPTAEALWYGFRLMWSN